MTERIRLSAIEISAILAVAGAADAPAVFEDEPDAKEGERLLDAYERGAEKLRRMLAAKGGEHE
jgi:hypothetical protein